MTIVHPPSTDRETNAIEHLDFAAPCERRRPGCANSAVLVADFSPYPCCGHPVRTSLYCSPCWARLFKTSLTCPGCNRPLEAGEIALQLRGVHFIHGGAV